jgi:hypothetical protein
MLRARFPVGGPLFVKTVAATSRVGRAQPTMAVVIPCHNAERWIGEAIASVLDQGCPSLELIVVDDGSTDSSREAIAAFDGRLRLLTGPNRGAGAARNRGLAAASSEFVLFLDADDYLVGDYLARLAAAAQPNVDVVVGGWGWAAGEGVVERIHAYADLQDPAALLAAYLTDPVQTAGLLWRREALIEAGGWPEGLPFYQDIELGLRMLLRLRPFALASLDEAMVVWRAHDGPRLSTNLSGEKIEVVLERLATHEPALSAIGHRPATLALARLYYTLAGAAFVCGSREVGEAALGRARRLGLRGHPGTLAHRLGSRLLGMAPKMRLAAALYELRSLPRHARPYPYNIVPG